MKNILVAILLVFAAVPATGRTDSVYYNTSSQIYHKHNCKWARRCTKNCVTIDKASARARGGRPCHVCGG